MTSESLLLSILAMDAYNRGYGAGLADQQSDDPDGLGLSGFVGPARILALPEGIDVNGWQAANFYAIAYTIGGGVEGIAPGATVISYRGTDNIGADIWSGWTIGAGWIGSGTQADEALAFYTAVTGKDWWEADNNAILTGHSLGGGLAGFVSRLSGTPGRKRTARSSGRGGAPRPGRRKMLGALPRLPQPLTPRRGRARIATTIRTRRRQASRYRRRCASAMA